MSSPLYRIATAITAPLVLVGVLLVVTVAASGVAAAANETDGAVDPVVDVEVDGSSVTAEDYTLVARDPRLVVTARVGADADENTTVKTVEVRVNGQTERVYEPGEAETTVSLVVPLDRGNNSVTVLAEDSVDRLTTRTVTVGKDDVAPWIGLTSPFESNLRSTIPNGTVDRSLVTIGVRSGEFSAVDRGTIAVDYNDSGESASVRDPGLRFEREMLLGHGNNTVTISLTDVVGNTRIQEFELEVVDDAAPSVSVDLYPKETTANRILLTGNVTDNVWVSNASIFVEHVDSDRHHQLHNYTKTIRETTEYEYDRSGRTVRFEETLDLQTGTNRITINASDHDGREVTETIEIERLESRDVGENEPPVVTIDRNRTRLREDGRVRLVAEVEDGNWNLHSVGIETENMTSGEIVDYERITDLESRHRNVLDTILRGTDGPTVVRVRARDDEGRRDVEVVQLAPGDESLPTTTTAAVTTTDGSGRTTDTFTFPPTTENGTENGSAAEADGSGGLPFVGALPVALLLGFVGGVVPFVVGSMVFVTMTYFVLRRVRKGGGESAS
jgi:hypothetical protein